MIEKFQREVEPKPQPKLIKEFYRCTECTVEFSNWYDADRHDLLIHNPVQTMELKIDDHHQTWYYFTSLSQASLYKRAASGVDELEWISPGWYGPVEYRDGYDDRCTKYLHASILEGEYLQEIKDRIRVIRQLRSLK